MELHPHFSQFLLIFALVILEISILFLAGNLNISAAKNLRKSRITSLENYRFLPFDPKNNSLSTIRIFNLKCPKSQELNDLLQTNSNSTVMYRIMLASIYAHSYIYIKNVQLKVTKSNVLSVDLVTFDCCLA
jgi:hypothetical protein